jgi:MPBQ/MSBQ methyltransferase
MPDKQRYIDQMTRALAPGGVLVVATWCQREAGVGGAPPLTESEKARLQFLYDEWAHPYFVSVEEYGRMMQVRMEEGGGEEGGLDRKIKKT